MNYLLHITVRIRLLCPQLVSQGKISTRYMTVVQKYINVLQLVIAVLQFYLIPYLSINRKHSGLMWMSRKELNLVVLK